jgi:hypothetical protein
LPVTGGSDCLVHHHRTLNSSSRSLFSDNGANLRLYARHPKPVKNFFDRIQKNGEESNYLPETLYRLRAISAGAILRASVALI